MLLNISDIQHFSLGDGEGIRTTVFFKGCNLRCPWCHNPETRSPEKQVLYYKNNITKECGKYMSIEEIAREVIADKDFYTESHGGVTFSGGEVMLQHEGALALAKRLKQEDINITIDTAGNVPYEYFIQLNDYVDEYLFDYKTPFADKYCEIIGGSLELITENIRKLIKGGKKVRIRIPLIPFFNTDDESIKLFCQKLTDIGCKNVDLLPFHRMGSGKYEALNMKYDFDEAVPLSVEEINHIKSKFDRYFMVKVEK